MLAHKRVQVEERDFFKKPFTIQELRELLASLDLRPRDVLSTKSPSFRAMGLDPDKLSEEEILQLMVEEPRLIRRPLIVIDGEPIIGLDTKRLETILK